MTKIETKIRIIKIIFRVIYFLLKEVGFENQAKVIISSADSSRQVQRQEGNAT